MGIHQDTETESERLLVMTKGDNKAEGLSPAQELHLSETIEEMDLLYHKLCVAHAGHCNLLEAVLDLVNLCKEILQVCHKFDFRGIPGNGFRSIVYKFVRLMRYTADVPASRIPDVMDILTELRSHIPTFREVLHDPVPEIPPLEIDRMVDAMHHFASGKRIINMIFNDVTLRFDIGRLGAFLTSFSFWFISFVLADSWIASFYNLFSSAARERTVKEFYRTCPINKVVHLLSYSRSVWHEHVIPFLGYGFRPSVRKYFQVPRQGVWKVQLDIEGEDVKLVRTVAAAPNCASIKCCVLKQNLSKGQPNEFEDVVLVYVHGGGFISNSVYNCNNFLPGFCRKLPGLTVVTIGLSLAPKCVFPTQIQETLDVYLWLQSQHESVVKAIGFQPKSFIFGCDSSGALITMSTIIIVNDMNHLLREKNHSDRTVVMPLSVVTHVPAFHIVPAMMPSLMLSVKDLILFPTTLTQMCFSYMPNISPSGVTDSTIELNQPESWFLNPPERTKQLIRRYEFLFKHPYYSPAFYNKYEELSDVQLHVLACHDDPILDSALIMLRRWQGKSSLHVSYTLRHAYFYFTAFSIAIFSSIRGRLSEAEDIFVSRVYESVKHSATKSIM